MGDRSSYEKINYSLRPAKAIERKMFCQSMQKLSHFQNIETYRYVGFGSPFFSDFSLIHRALGISNLISLEKDDQNKDRFIFNRPFSCIESIFKHSNDALPGLGWSQPTILWLDYDYKLSSNMLKDVTTFFSQAGSGSMFVITFDIKADEPKNEKLTTKKLKQFRIDELRKRVGREYLPADIERKNLGHKGNIPIIHEIVNDLINEVLITRNGVIPDKYDRFLYKQIFNFYYNDGTPMLTLGGILFKEKQKDIFKKANFNELGFTKPGKTPFIIEVPSLTYKEIRALDQLLPDKIDLEDGKVKKSSGKSIKLPNLRKEDIIKYSKVYRYFPAFAETNL